MKTFILRDDEDGKEVFHLRPAENTKGFAYIDPSYLVARLDVDAPYGLFLSRQDCYTLAERLLRIARKARW